MVMASYFFAIMLGVWYLLKRSDKLYGNLYGRMTDAEVKSIRIERDLNDPARLLNDLAEDGLDFGTLFGGPTDGAATSASIDTATESQESEKQPVADFEFGTATEVESDA